MKLISRQEAQEQGLTHYFTGKPCKTSGHVAKRFVSSFACAECVPVSMRNWRVKDREAYKIRNRRRYADRRDKVLVLLGNKCACCGKKQKEFLTIDHKNNDGAAHRRSLSKSRGGATWRMFMWALHQPVALVKKTLQILCWDCNCSRGVYGYCPCQQGAK